MRSIRASCNVMPSSLLADIIVGMTSVFEMTDFGTVVDATPQYEDNVGGGGSALASLTPAFEVLFRPVVCRDVAACAAKAELARGEILLTALGSGANNNPNATRVLGDGAGSELALQTMALGSRVMDKPAPTEPPPKVPTPVYVYFLIGFGCLILVVFTYTAVANLRHAADTPQVNGGPAVKDGYKKPRTLTFRTGKCESAATRTVRLACTVRLVLYDSVFRAFVESVSAEPRAVFRASQWFVCKPNATMVPFACAESTRGGERVGSGRRITVVYSNL